MHLGCHSPHDGPGVVDDYLAGIDRNRALDCHRRRSRCNGRPYEVVAIVLRSSNRDEQDGRAGAARVVGYVREPNVRVTGDLSTDST
jgi:hypothetical protein